MDYIYINKLLTTSIYKQIASSVTDAIDLGLLKYNDKLPTEKEICQAFSISQTAVKMAYEKLITEGKIKRIKGKGTYVTNRATFRTDLHSFYEVNVVESAQNEIYTKQTIMLGKTSKDYSANRELKLKNSEQCYLIVHVIKSKQNQMLLQKIYLPKKYFTDFEKRYKKDTSLYPFIEKEYNYEIKHIHSTFSAINASASDALLLGMNPDDAIYFIREKIIDKEDNVIAYICNYFPGEFTEFEVIVHAI